MIEQNELYESVFQSNLKKKNSEVQNNYNRSKELFEKKLYDKISEEGLLPYRVDFEPTSRCFLNCRYCQVPNWKRKELPDLSFEEFKRRIDTMPWLLETKLQGQGEPLLNADLFKMIRYAADKDIIVRINTNGMLLDEEKRKAVVNSGLFELRLSLDGASKATNEIMRPGLDFDRVVHNITELSKLRGKNTLPLLNIWMLLSKNNINELEDMVDLCSRMGVDGLKIQTKLSVRNEDIEKKVIQENVGINSSQVNDLFDRVSAKAKEKGLYLEIFKQKWRTKENPCWWIWNSSSISSDGYVMPCCIITDPADINFGNLKDQDFSTIWKGEKYNSFARDLINMRISPLCKWCYKESW